MPPTTRALRCSALLPVVLPPCPACLSCCSLYLNRAYLNRHAQCNTLNQVSSVPHLRWHVSLLNWSSTISRQHSAHTGHHNTNGSCTYRLFGFKSHREAWSTPSQRCAGAEGACLLSRRPALYRHTHIARSSSCDQ